MAGGRPRTQDRKALGVELCRRVANGELVMDVTDSLGVARSAPFDWYKDDDEFAALYDAARIQQAHSLAQQLVQIAAGQDPLTLFYKQAIAEEEVRLRALGVKKVKVIVRALNTALVMRDRLRVDTLKWYCAKLAPKLFGEKIDVTSGGEPIKAPQHMTVEYIEPAAAMPALPPGPPVATTPPPREDL